MMNLQVLTVLAVAVGVCQGAKYNAYKPWKDDCHYPTWTCDCKIVYDCKSDGVFPDVADNDNAGYIRNLAPDDYPLRISGGARRNARTQEAFCKKECHDRLNAFLCLDSSGRLSDYSYSALCLKIFELELEFEGPGQPCCALWLEYGRQWCPKKCNRSLSSVRCLSLGIDSTFTDNTSPAADLHNVFGAEGGCAIDSAPSFDWCDSIPACPPIPPVVE